MKTDRGALQEIVRIGFPSAVQQTVTAFSNVFVQSYINSFGSNAMAGWSAYGKIDQFMMLPMQSVALAATTFVGQNHGARREDRVKKGTRNGSWPFYGDIDSCYDSDSVLCTGDGEAV